MSLKIFDIVCEIGRQETIDVDFLDGHSRKIEDFLISLGSNAEKIEEDFSANLESFAHLIKGAVLIDKHVPYRHGSTTPISKLFRRFEILSIESDSPLTTSRDQLLDWIFKNRGDNPYIPRGRGSDTDLFSLDQLRERERSEFLRKQKHLAKLAKEAEFLQRMIPKGDSVIKLHDMHLSFVFDCLSPKARTLENVEVLNYYFGVRFRFGGKNSRPHKMGTRAPVGEKRFVWVIKPKSCLTLDEFGTSITVPFQQSGNEPETIAGKQAIVFIRENKSEMSKAKLRFLGIFEIETKAQADKNVSQWKRRGTVFSRDEKAMIRVLN